MKDEYDEGLSSNRSRAHETDFTCIMVLSVMVHRARMAGPRYISSLPVMSFVKEEVTMMTSSEILDKSLMAKYTIRLRTGSLD